MAPVANGGGAAVAVDSFSPAPAVGGQPAHPTRIEQIGQGVGAQHVVDSFVDQLVDEAAFARLASRTEGRVGDAVEAEGAVFVVSRGDYEGETFSYIENASATRKWTADAVLTAAADTDKHYVGSGKTMFVREGCWWCHTLLPEQTQDWQYFGLPPRLGDFNGESPTAFGSDRKAPDLLHVGSRNSSKEWMMMHFFNPRLVQPHSIMPRFDYLWGEVDANGNEIDYDQWRADYKDYAAGTSIYPPEVPDYAPNSEIRYLMDYVLSLK